MRTLIIALTLMFAAAPYGAAQKAIDKIITEICNSSSGKDECIVSYSEKRDPKTKKVEKANIMLKISNEKLINRFKEAFRKERGNAVELNILRNGTHVNLVFKSPDGKEQESYTMKIHRSRDNKQQATIIIDKKSSLFSHIAYCNARILPGVTG